MADASEHLGQARLLEELLALATKYGENLGAVDIVGCFEAAKWRVFSIAQKVVDLKTREDVEDLVLERRRGGFKGGPCR